MLAVFSRRWGKPTLSMVAATPTSRIPANPGYQELDMDGPKVNNATRLVDVVRRNGLEYENAVPGR